MGALTIYALAGSVQTGAQESLVTHKSLAPAIALALAQAALADCQQRGYQVAVAVVDRFGVIQVVLRDRYAGPHTPATASGKAWTAATFRNSTSNDDNYGEVEYAYANRSDISRSTSPREILPLLYGLAGASPPAPASGGDYPGYPLAANGQVVLIWFFCGLPLCIALAWWRSRRLPEPITARFTKEVQS